jgi:hypothetical protein
MPTPLSGIRVGQRRRRNEYYKHLRHGNIFIMHILVDIIDLSVWNEPVTVLVSQCDFVLDQASRNMRPSNHRDFRS